MNAKKKQQTYHYFRYLHEEFIQNTSKGPLVGDLAAVADKADVAHTSLVNCRRR